MPKWLNRFVEFLLLRKNFEIKTKLPKERVLKKMAEVTSNKDSFYRGKVNENGFSFKEKSKLFSKHFRPYYNTEIRATVYEEDGLTHVKCVIAVEKWMEIYYHIFRFIVMLMIIPIPLIILNDKTLFFKQAKALTEELEYLLVY